MWFQVPGAPISSSLFLKAALILMILSATDLISAFHDLKCSGLLRILSTILAPREGGTKQLTLMTLYIWFNTVLAISLFGVTMCKAPILQPYSPMFLAQDCETTSSKPSSTKCLTANASLIKSPLANPWQAESKKGSSFFSFMTWAIFFHSSFVGSTPVGLWAQTCKRTMFPGWALFRVSTNLSIKALLVAGSQQGYSSNLSPDLVMMLWWLAQVGLETSTFDGVHSFKNSNPTLRAPVPDKDCTVTILPSFTAWLSFPKISSCETLLNSADPLM